MPIMILVFEFLDTWNGIFVYITFLLMCFDLAFRASLFDFIKNDGEIFKMSCLLFVAIIFWLLGVVLFDRPDFSGLASLIMMGLLLNKHLQRNSFDLLYSKLASIPGLLIMLTFAGGLLFSFPISGPTYGYARDTLESLSYLFNSLNQTSALGIVLASLPFLMFFARNRSYRRLITVLAIVFLAYLFKSGALTVLAGLVIVLLKPMLLRPIFLSLLCFLVVLPLLLLFADLSFFVDNPIINIAMSGRGDIWYQCSVQMKQNIGQALLFGVGGDKVRVDLLNGVTALAGDYSYHSGYIRLFMQKGVITYYICLIAFWLWAKKMSNNFSNMFCGLQSFTFALLLLTDGSFFYSLGTIVYFVYPSIILNSISRGVYVKHKFND
ncbi:hypothetical protein OAW16_06340 [Pseudomonadales bacterium]|nr:hypothetical protein [Pseudomonadales bacterium]